VLWFRFSENKEDTNPLIGLEYYLQASGTQAKSRSDESDDIKNKDWNKASERLSNKQIEFEESVGRWIQSLPQNSGILLLVSTVRFNGKKRNWQGGGIEDLDALRSKAIPPKDALSFIKDNRDSLWCFPKVAIGSEGLPRIEDIACKVCKPAISLLIPLDISELAKLENREKSLQHFLQKAVASLTEDY
jgi:hypothetical protein